MTKKSKRIKVKGLKLKLIYDNGTLIFKFDKPMKFSGPVTLEYKNPHTMTTTLLKI